MTPDDRDYQLRMAARRCAFAKACQTAGTINSAIYRGAVDDAAMLAEAYLGSTRQADATEPVSAPAMRQEPGWTQGFDDNCFWRDGVLGTLRVWPNTGCIEFGNYVLVRAGATLGDIRKLAAVLCREGRA